MSEQVLGVTTPENKGSEDPVATLVGEGKKFKTVADLAKGKLESDNFVKQLQEENKALRELAQAKAEGENKTLLSELVTSLTTKANTDSTGSTQTNQSAKTGLTEDEVNRLIEAREQKTTAQSNVSAFNTIVSKAFADKAPQEVSARLAAVGADPQLFSQLVARSPKAALAMLGLENTSTAASGGMSQREGSINTESLQNLGAGQVKNAAYFRDLRKKLGSSYYDPKIQQDLFKSRKELGDKFYQ